MYADDTALCASDNDSIVAANKVTDSEDLEVISKWCADNCLQINRSETLAMFLSRNNVIQSKKSRNANILLLNGSPLQTVSEFQYLLDNKLTFNNSFTTKALSSLRKSQQYLPLSTRKFL